MFHPQLADLLRINDVEPHIAKILYDSGITNVSEMAQLDHIFLATRLFEFLQHKKLQTDGPLTAAFFLPVAKSMIEQARVLVRTDAEAFTSKELGQTPSRGIPDQLNLPSVLSAGGDALHHEPLADDVDTEEDFLNAYSALETA
jgi:hypothetical protein